MTVRRRPRGAMNHCRRVRKGQAIRMRKKMRIRTRPTPPPPRPPRNPAVPRWRTTLPPIRPLAPKHFHLAELEHEDFYDDDLFALFAEYVRRRPCGIREHTHHECSGDRLAGSQRTIDPRDGRDGMPDQ